MRKLKINKEDGFQDGEIVSAWSGKRILIGLVILALVLAGGFYALTQVRKKAETVLGVESGPEIKTQGSKHDVRLPTKEDADELLEQAKKELNLLTSENLTSSQAALQKVIQDLETIQSGKESPVDTFCELVCKK